MPGLNAEVDEAPTRAPATPRRAWVPLAVGLGVAGVVAFVVSLIVTRHSPGFYPDSSVYLGTAQNLLDGRGLTTPFNLQFNPYPPAQAFAFHGEFPLTHFPPLYPLVLAVLGKFTSTLVDGARLLDAFLFAVNVVLAGLLTWRITRSTVVAVVTAFGLVATAHVVLNHALVMSEPLMLAFVLGGVLLTPRMLRSPGRNAVIAVGACAGAATLTRLAGVAFTATLVVVALVWVARPLRARIRTAALLAALGLGPLVLFMLVTRLTTDASGVRPVRLHLPPTAFYDGFYDAVSSWFVGAGADVNRALVVVVVVLLVAGLAVVVATDRVPSDASVDERDHRRDSDQLLAVLAIFAVTYVVVILVTAALLDAETTIDGRLLVPVQVAGALVVVGLVFRAAARVGSPVVAASVAVVVVVLAAWPWREVSQGFLRTSTASLIDRGFGGGAPSPLGKAVSALPDGALIAAQFPATLWAGSGRDVVFVPPRRFEISGEDNEEYRAQLVELGRILGAHRGYLALYPGVPDEFASAAELAKVMRLTEVGAFRDGTLYRVDGLQPGVS